MCFNYWWFFLLLKIFISSTSKPMLMSFSLLAMSFSILMLLLKNFMLWYSIIFFLVYVGAILVLMFYLVCMNSNPMNYKIYWWNLFIGIFFFSSFFFFKTSFRVLNLNFTFLSFFEKFLMIFLFSMLLLMLWMMSKFTFLSVGSIRSFV